MFKITNFALGFFFLNFTLFTDRLPQIIINIVRKQTNFNKNKLNKKLNNNNKITYNPVNHNVTNNPGIIAVKIKHFKMYLKLGIDILARNILNYFLFCYFDRYLSF